MEKLVRHSENVKAPGTYVELIDVLLFCTYIGMNPILYINDGQEMTNSKPMKVFFQDLLGAELAAQMICKEGERDIGIVLTRTDFEPSCNPAEWNHWVVCFPSGKMNLKQRIKIVQRSLSEYLSDCRDALAEIPAAEKEMKQSMLDIMEHEQEKMRRFQALTKKLFEASGLFPVQVGADGNCGIWALMSLLETTPEPESLQHFEFRNTDEEEMMAIRADLSTMWLSVSVQQPRVWGTVFEMMASQAANPPCASTSSKTSKVPDVPDPTPGKPSASSAEADGGPDGPATPIKDSKYRQKVPGLPEITPPRVSQVARRQPGAGVVAPRPVTGASVPLMRFYEKWSNGHGSNDQGMAHGPPIKKVKLEDVKEEELSYEATEADEWCPSEIEDDENIQNPSEPESDASDQMMQTGQHEVPWWWPEQPSPDGGYQLHDPEDGEDMVPPEDVEDREDMVPASAPEDPEAAVPEVGDQPVDDEDLPIAALMESAQIKISKSSKTQMRKVKERSWIKFMGTTWFKF